MADTFGAVELPLAAPVGDEPVSDPALRYIGEFVKAVLNTYAAAAWSSVSPKHEPVRFVFTHDPEKLDVKDTEFPAVFVYRVGSKPEWRGDDYAVDSAKIQIFWLFEPVPRLRQISREPFLNGILKPLYRAFARGRSPAWKLEADIDPGKAKRGTVLWGACGFISERVSEAMLEGISITVENGERLRELDGIGITIFAEERLDEDPEFYAAGSGEDGSALTLEVKNSEGDVILVVDTDPPEEPTP